jgi:nuclear pore complex protein Nup93
MSSLFSNLGGNPPASSGASTSGAPATSSLFSGPAASSSAPKPRLFGNLGASTSAAPQTSQPATSGGGLGGGLFGGLGGASTATTAPATTSRPPLSLGGSTAQPQQTNSLGQSTLFGTISTQQQQQQSGGPLSQSNAGTGRSAHFDHLLERGRKRNVGENGLNNFNELPALQLGLGDIARKVRNLGNGGPSADQAQDRAA